MYISNKYCIAKSKTKKYLAKLKESTTTFYGAEWVQIMERLDIFNGRDNCHYTTFSPHFISLPCMCIWTKAKLACKKKVWRVTTTRTTVFYGAYYYYCVASFDSYFTSFHLKLRIVERQWFNVGRRHHNIHRLSKWIWTDRK